MNIESFAAEQLVLMWNRLSGNIRAAVLHNTPVPLILTNC